MLPWHNKGGKYLDFWKNLARMEIKSNKAPDQQL